MDNREITVLFKLMFEKDFYPVSIKQSATVKDLIDACAKKVNIHPDHLNVRNYQKNLNRHGTMSFYHISDGTKIIGTKKFEFNNEYLENKTADLGNNVNNSVNDNQNINTNDNDFELEDNDDDFDVDNSNSDSFDQNIGDSAMDDDDDGTNKKGKKKKAT